MMKIRACELCNAEAILYCDADSAFLCFACDDKVHGANFLVARHVRRRICSACRDFSSPLCPSCSGKNQNDVVTSPSSSSSASSACISSTESSSAKRKASDREVTSSLLRIAAADARAEGILVIWCRKLGLTDCSSTVSVASQAVALCLSDPRRVPFRVCLAASFWFGLRVMGCSTWQNLNRVQEVAGVPAKVIVAGQVKIERLIKGKRLMMESTHQIHEEGWDECSN